VSTSASNAQGALIPLSHTDAGRAPPQQQRQTHSQPPADHRDEMIAMLMRSNETLSKQNQVLTNEIAAMRIQIAELTALIRGDGPRRETAKRGRGDREYESTPDAMNTTADGDEDYTVVHYRDRRRISPDRRDRDRDAPTPITKKAPTPKAAPIRKLKSANADRDQQAAAFQKYFDQQREKERARAAANGDDDWTASYDDESATAAAAATAPATASVETAGKRTRK